MTPRTIGVLVLLAAALTPCARGATDADAIADADAVAPPLQLEWDARWRYATLDDDAFAHTGFADTLRLRIGVAGAFGNGWSALVEGAGIASAGNRYNSGANGQVQYPLESDPRGAVLNQAWLAWQRAEFSATVGRQRLQFDNQRWIGNSGWRQFEQTFDAVAFRWQATPSLALRYAWLDRVHRVSGPDALNPLARARALDTHLVNAAWTHATWEWVGYAYLHEDRDVPSASTATVGTRWTGHLRADAQGLGWALEAARQRKYANNPLSFSHAYWLAEPSWTVGTFTATLGWEYLGGNGHHALQTPLASLHPFNGWAGEFGVIPNGGLKDGHVGATGRFGSGRLDGKLAWALTWHAFQSVRGSRYGTETDGSLSLPLTRQVAALFEVASYRADTFARNDARVWLQLEWKGTHAL
ncbi:MAG TPA: alginate export family protein [Rhodanobacteraceae bacterium]|nr:alginate export family protein [Rhodanobacteraceae bacterium]